MYRGVNIAITQMKNNSSLKAYVKQRIYPHSVALLEENKKKFPCIAVEVDSNESPGENIRIHKVYLTISIFSTDSYLECEEIYKLLTGQDTTANVGILHRMAYTNSGYTAHFVSLGGGTRSAEKLNEKGNTICYWMNTRWLMWGYYD